MNSNLINDDSLVDMIFHLKWHSEAAVHTDVYQASRINIWRDHLPPMLAEGLLGKEAGERLLVPLRDGEAVAAFSARKLFDIEGSRFDRRFNAGETAEPRQGRFYPQGMLKGIAGVFKANIQPFRCIGLNNGHLTVDLNHPLAGRDLQLSVVIGKVEAKGVERGGTSIDWMETLTSGPGMQTRWQMQPTDFFKGDALKRADEQPDELFYRKPRLVHHIDETARDVVKNTYGRFLTDGMQVLDLMSSWQSHIPANLHLNGLVGLGLNQNELRQNSQLSDLLVHDLNADPKLPFESNTFDAVVNTASVEYLTDPLAVFNEVARILRPEGYFIVTFSNRWFPPKAVRIWRELHEFERMGLVLEYFLRTDGFKDLQTYSIRGLPRPHDDKYFPEFMFSDPVYAVWGRKR
jgi:FKBP-type peptidyl-prolyl cis-trans isomerase 2